MYRLARQQIDTCLFANDVEKSKLNQILDGFSYERFTAMRCEWLTKGRMLWYSYGNLAKEQSISVVDGAIALLDLESVAKDELLDARHIDLSSAFHRLDFTV